MDNRELLENMINQMDEKHQDIIRKYIKVRRRVDKVSEISILTNIASILAISKHTKKNFIDLTADDIQDIEQKLKTTPMVRRYYLNGKIQTIDTHKNYSEVTITRYMTEIKMFMKFVHYPDQYARGSKFRKKIQDPPCVEWITVQRTNNEIPADYILKDKDIEKMLKVCNNLRDQGIIALLYDAGLRRQELLNLNINSITFKEGGGEVIIPPKSKGNKTGARRVFLHTSVPYLRDFLNKHPFKEYPHAPLFYTKNRKATSIIKENKTLNQDTLEKLRINKGSIRAIIKEIGLKAKIPCHVYPHLFRHSSATNWAKIGLNESELRRRYGWSKTSTMPSKYIHLASPDMDKKIMTLLGLEAKSDVEKERAILAPKICVGCNHENCPTDTFCSICRMPLNVDALRKSLTHREQVEQDVDILERYDPLVVKAVIAGVMKVVESKITKKEEDRQKI